MTRAEIEKRRHYTVCSSYDLRKMCIENDWFTAGDNRQYQKLFESNIHSEGSLSVRELATIIWVCSSNASFEEILEKLEAKKEEYIQFLYDYENE